LPAGALKGNQPSEIKKETGQAKKGIAKRGEFKLKRSKRGVCG